MMDGWSLVAFAGLTGAAVAAYVLLRRPGSVPDKYDTGTGETGYHKPVKITRNSPPKREAHFYASSVKPGLNCCDAVKQIAHQRYLLNEEPSFPLPDCDREDCRCIMQPQDDRRTHFDRRDDRFSAYGEFQESGNPRRRDKGPDRRHT
jgi:hypothetical protein